MPAIGVIALSTGAQVKHPLKLVATTPLPGFSGDFDHFALDLKGQRLFLTAEDHKTVEVFDLDGKHLHSITGFGQPHAALFLPESNKLIVTDGDDDFGRVEMVSGTDYKILSTDRKSSELQSQSNLVCRLLLEKKKNKRPSSSDQAAPPGIRC